MTKISFYALIVLGFSAFLSSCQIEKQYHSNGFKISGPQWGISANKGQSSNRSAISPDQNQQNNSTNKTKTTNLHYSKSVGSKKTQNLIEANASKTFKNCIANGLNNTIVTTTNPIKSSSNPNSTNSSRSYFWDRISRRNFQYSSNSPFYRTNGNSAMSTKSSLGYLSNKPSNVLPPDTVIIYDTVFEEEVLIIPDSIKVKHDAMMLKSQELREKSLLPTVGGYVLLLIGSIGVFLSVIVAAFSFGQAITPALLILAGSLIVFLFSGLSISKGMKMESEARMLAKKAKALITPFEAPKPKSTKTKKSNKKLLIGILIGYVILQFGAAILSAL